MSTTTTSPETVEAMEQLNRFFDHVFVITIERNRDRRTLLEENLRGLEFSYLEGVDGSRVDESRLQSEYDEAGARRVYGKSMAPGQIGCALSHRAAYSETLKQGYERVLILEDDAAFPAPTAPLVAPVLEQLPGDWDLIYMFAQREGESRWLDAKVRWVYPLMNRVGLRHYDMDEIRKRYSAPYSENLRVAGMHWVALAYGITAQAARHLIQQQTPVTTVADDVLRTFSGRPDTNVFVADPPVFRPRAGLDSTIWNRPQRPVARRHAWP